MVMMTVVVPLRHSSAHSSTYSRPGVLNALRQWHARVVRDFDEDERVRRKALRLVRRLDAEVAGAAAKRLLTELGADNDDDGDDDDDDDDGNDDDDDDEAVSRRRPRRQRPRSLVFTEAPPKVLAPLTRAFNACMNERMNE